MERRREGTESVALVAIGSGTETVALERKGREEHTD